MKRVVATAIAVLVMSVTPAWVHADIVFQLGNNPQPDEENVLLNSGETGNPVFGSTQQSNITMRFSSTTDTLTEPSSGQARVEAVDGLVNNITIDIPGGTYADLIVNPFFGSGTATVTVQTSLSVFQYTLGNGNNFLTIFAINGERIESVTIDAPEGFTDLRQPRISGAALTQGVPEPGIVLLLGSGFGAAALLPRRKNS
jgi:hypothetical protein